MDTAMTTRQPRLLLMGLLGLCLMSLGCGPSYRKEELASSIEHICATDFHFQVTARQHGRTIAVHLHHRGILQPTSTNQIGLAPTAISILEVAAKVLGLVITSSSFFNPAAR